MSNLEGIFSRFADEFGLIPSGRIEDALRAAGRKDISAAMKMFEMLDSEEKRGTTFEQFAALTDARDAPVMDFNSGGSPVRARSATTGAADGSGPGPLDDGPDPRVDEFLRVLEEYRTKCEKEGNYEEAARCTDQLAAIRKAEEERRTRSLMARHVAERQEVASTHATQYTEFNSAWERYLAEYDAMAAMYVTQMQERHGQKLREFQEGLHKELLHKPVKQGREVLDWRNREQQLVKQRLYAEATRVKAVADELERKERSKLDDERLHVFAGREAKFRGAQKAELEALLKRIETRRQEHTKQWDLDSKRLLQRNRNVMAVLEQRQASEEQKKLAEIRQQLQPPRVHSKMVKSDIGRKPRKEAPMPEASLAVAFSAGVDPSAAAMAMAPGGHDDGARSAQVSSNAAFRSPGSARMLVMRSQAGVSGSGALTAESARRAGSRA